MLYELTWLCNCTLVLGCWCFGFAGLADYSKGGGGDGSFGGWLLKRRPLVASASCVAVSIDQVLWYVDLVVWAVRYVLGHGDIEI